MRFSDFTQHLVTQVVESIREWNPGTPSQVHSKYLRGLRCELRKTPGDPSSERDVSELATVFINNALALFPGPKHSPQHSIHGYRSHGRVDFAIVSKTRSVVFGIIEAKLADEQLGIAQNIMQLEALITSRPSRPKNAKSHVRYGVVVTKTNRRVISALTINSFTCMTKFKPSNANTPSRTFFSSSPLSSPIQHCPQSYTRILPFFLCRGNERGDGWGVALGCLNIIQLPPFAHPLSRPTLQVSCRVSTVARSFSRSIPHRPATLIQSHPGLPRCRPFPPPPIDPYSGAVQVSQSIHIQAPYRPIFDCAPSRNTTW